MRRSVLSVLALTLVSALPGTARAVPVAGLSCGMVSTTDPLGILVNPGTQAGEFFGAVVSTDGTLNGITVECYVVQGTGHANDFVVSNRATGTGPGVAIPLPGPALLIEYSSSPTTASYVCTKVTAASGVWYFDTVTSGLVASPAAAKCHETISQEVPPAEVCSLAFGACDLLDLIPASSFPADVRVALPDLILARIA